jgi:hypothetical protein
MHQVDLISAIDAVDGSSIRLDQKDALAYCNRGNAKLIINDNSGSVDIAKARE